MKEIKFRVWEDSKLFEPNSNLPTKLHSWEEMCKWNKSYFAQVIQKEFSTFILMQFTGLNDKNGKEIYEGDILLRECFEDIADVPIREYYIVEIKNQRFAHLIDNLEDWSDIFKSDEIIGNIYENSELLIGGKLI